MSVGDFLQFQSSLPRNGIVNAPAEVKERLGLPVLLREFNCSRIPGWNRTLHRFRQFQQPFQISANHLTGHAALFTGEEQGK